MIERFARSERVSVTVYNESMLTVVFAPNTYDLVLMNGCLHYIHDKAAALARVCQASAPDAVHALSLFSHATPLPAEHSIVPVFPDLEGGVVEQFYREWGTRLLAYDRGQVERSHPGFATHAHSHIKLIAGRTPGLAKERL